MIATLIDLLLSASPAFSGDGQRSRTWIPHGSNQHTNDSNLRSHAPTDPLSSSL